MEVSNFIKKCSDQAIRDGYKFPGFAGKNVSELSREDLEGVLNWLYREKELSSKSSYNKQIRLIKNNII